MTYDEIEQALKGTDSKYARTYVLERLREAVEDEAEALRLPDHVGRVRSSKERHATAQDFYAEDISRLLSEPSTPLIAADILSRRRKATAWAIAEVLRECGVSCQKQDSASV
jgi:hypothetical protein